MAVGESQKYIEIAPYQYIRQARDCPVNEGSSHFDRKSQLFEYNTEAIME